MGRLVWQDQFADWREAVSILNNLGWNLSWKDSDGKWWLYGGESVIFIGDTEGEFRAFLCGMALGLAVLPESILRQIQAIANEE